MKGLVWGRVGVGSLETTKPKSVMAGIWQRGQWDIIRFSRDEWGLEVQVIEDAVMYGSEVLEFELVISCMEPLEESNLVVMEEGSLEDISNPLALLCMPRRVVDMTRNGGLNVE